MCSLENRILCQGENSILRPENMLIHPISITHEDTIMPKKIQKIFRKSPRPSPKLTTQPHLVSYYSSLYPILLYWYNNTGHDSQS